MDHCLGGTLKILKALSSYKDTLELRSLGTMNRVRIRSS